MSLPIQRSRVADLLELTAVGILCVPVATFAIAVGSFALDVSLHVWMLGAAWATTAAVLHVNCRSVRTTSGVWILIALLHAVAIGYAVSVLDESFDGLWYHQEAVLQLANGWNPILNDTERLGTPAHAALWIDHYPKGSWVAAAPWFLLTGLIDAGKLLNVTMLLGAACMIAATLLRLTTLGPIWVLWLAGVGAVNPIAVSQSSSYMVDGVLGCLLAVLVASFSGFLVEGRHARLWPGWLAIVLLANLKFTGLVYAVFFCALTAGAAAVRLPRAMFRRFCVGTALVLTLAVPGLGYAPYVRNLLEHGTPLYPLSGPDPYDLTSIDRPANLTSHDRVTRFLISAFSRTGWVASAEGTELKAPWSVDRSELFLTESPNSGGFGPLYGAALIGCVVVLLIVAREPRSWLQFAIAAAMCAIFISIFVHSEGWWMRYVPQAWLLPCMAALMALLAAGRTTRAAGFALLVVISGNLGLVCLGYAAYQQWVITNTRAYLRELREAPKPVHVYVHAFPGFRERLRGADIQFVEIPPASYSSSRDALTARNFMPPGPPLSPGIALRAVPPHRRVLWHAASREGSNRR